MPLYDVIITRKITTSAVIDAADERQACQFLEDVDALHIHGPVQQYQSDPESLVQRLPVKIVQQPLNSVALTPDHDVRLGL